MAFDVCLGPLVQPAFYDLTPTGFSTYLSLERDSFTGICRLIRAVIQPSEASSFGVMACVDERGKGWVHHDRLIQVCYARH